LSSISFVKEKLRPGSSYQLVEWNELNITEQKMLSGLHDEAEVYGIFQPLFSSSHLTKKVAYKEVALLYLHLNKTNNLPHYLFLSAEEKLNETITQLVLDNILEIEYEGNFVSGTAAVKAIFGETFFENEIIPDYLSKLSMGAIQYALLLHDLDMRSLSRKLYTFNTTPWNEYAKSKFYAEHSIKEFLFPSANKEINNLLSEFWLSNLSEGKYWLSWWKKKANEDFLITSDKPTFKLYISPVINDLPKVFQRVIPILSASSVFNFKIGGNIEALLRPDKMVVYFENRKELMETASLLKKELKGYKSQGVPFTSQIDEQGILSWGVDPADSAVLSTIEAGSWRLKVTDQLALAILQAQKDRLNLQLSIQFIRKKLLSVGINTESWTSIEHSKEFSS
jgi:hypothetical protein